MRSGDFADLCERLLASGTSVKFEARGGSMRPLLREGDVLTVDPARAAELHVGHIVLYRDAAGRAVVHRLVGRDRKSGMLLVRGDAQFTRPDLLDPAEVLGRVISLSRGGTTLELDGGAARRALRILYLSCRARFVTLTGRCGHAPRDIRTDD